MLTREEAIEFFESKKWESMTDLERAEFQLYEERLCMPIEVFIESLDKVLGRPICTDELLTFNVNDLRNEFFKHKESTLF